MTNTNPNAARRWVVLLGLALTYAATNGILVHTLPLIYPHLMETFNWTPTQVTLPATVFYAVAAVTSPPAGYLLDRYSSRLVIAVGLVGIVAALFGYSMINELGQLVVVYIVFAFALSMCGLVSNMLILSRWFTELRGRATGLLLMSSSIGGSIFPLIVGFFLATIGWRGGMQVLALIVVVVALLPIIFLVRDRPERIPLESGLKTSKAPGRNGPTLRRALSERRFYLLALATAAVWFSIIAMVQHQSIYLSGEGGVAKSQLPLVFSAFFLCSVLGKLIFGWLSDHFDKTLMMLVSIATLVVGLLLLRNVQIAGNASLFGYAIVAGIGFSGAFTMIQLMFADFYAGASFGRILAILMMVDTLSGALGTRVVAVLRDSTGSYIAGIDLMIGLLVLAFGCVLILKPEQPEKSIVELPTGDGT
ncbi:MAG: MFS transporter [Woeseiaceae bacterium]